MILEEYQPRWADEFRALRDVLRQHLGPLAIAVHHVGSTSIPGMPAKPNLDVDIEIPAHVSVATISAKLAEKGYEYEGELGIAGRHAYRQTDADVPFTIPRRSWMNQHVYVCHTGTDELRRHLDFRDSLVACAELRDQYIAIKRQCVARATDGQTKTYQAAKDELAANFLSHVLAMEPISQRANRAGWLLEKLERLLESGQIDERQWYRDVAEVITPAYLWGTDPRSQSGNSGDEASWTHSRSLICDAVDRDGTFLDVGCASGYLMESVRRWSDEKSLNIEPYGLDIAPELVELARMRLPRWKDRIFQGNAIEWRPAARFDFVRTGLEYVPRRRQRDLVHHLLNNVVAPGGRLIVGTYNEARASVAEPLVEELVGSWGFADTGHSERPHRDCRLCYRVIWIDAS